MADRVFFVAGSTDDLIRGMSVPQQMISDLLEISRIPTAVVEQIGTALEKATGFLDDTRLEALVKEAITEETTVDAIISALREPPPVLRGTDFERSRGMAKCRRSPR